ncbi:TetR/AcrR family transcriptional regulator [Actinomadura rayongensis]|uniref:TetR family transcriptional regulator n=1 Tax=Actinomadura rayongensis TaxID=1429076 RepID=A0A6I4W646_9ACTN|nr:TetR/AcrR family transcriptional regulator [Actinomadura rayongensis]MXQ63666.1 TetR family transcriptional regulator [Actinomadura rayongensis]
MPKVSAAHRERRRRQILDAALACFLRKGLHETSMQDIFAESGLSAGAVYRYFPSKDELIKAITAEASAAMNATLGPLITQDPPAPFPEVIAAVAPRIAELARDGGPLCLAPQAWALALSDPGLGDHVRETMAMIRDLWIGYAARLAETGALPPGTDHVAVGKAMFGLMPGFLLQTVVLGDITPDELATGVGALVRPDLRAARG